MVAHAHRPVTAPMPLPRPAAPAASTDSLVTLGTAFSFAVTTGAWIGHGGLGGLAGGGTRSWLAIAQLTGLWAGLLAWAGIVLAARPDLLERGHGLDGLLRAHRWVGTVTVATVLAHVLAVVVAYADTSRSGLPALFEGFVSLLAEPWMVSATAAAVVFLTIGITSWRRLRARMPYETWYFLHLTAYGAVVLAIGHQFTSGSDISRDPVMTAWWAALTFGALALAVFARARGIALTLLRGTLTVTRVEPAGTATVALTVAGPGLRNVEAEPGQFFRMRVLTRGLWWQSHPFSVSAAPTTAGVRFTVKALGDATETFAALRPGTRVLLSGPYGVFTARAAAGRRVALLGAGVGLAPLRAVLEDCDASQRPAVLVRAGTSEGVPHREEIVALAHSRSGTYWEALGPTSQVGQGMFAPEVLRSVVPDITERTVYVCGPDRFARPAVAGLRAAGVPASRIRWERFDV